MTDKPLSPDHVVCPSCDGEKRVFAFVNRGDNGCSSGWFDCHTCGGTGEITLEHQARIAEGRNRMRDRVSRGVSLMEEAKRLGMRPSELSAIEHGRAPK